MYSVILTEFGIAVFVKEEFERSFPFENAVREYISVKKKQAKVGELVRYLESMQRGVKTNDESLLWLLSKYSIDAQMMEEDRLEEIRMNKPQIIADAGFAKDAQDAMGKLRDFSVELSSSKVTEISGTADLHIIQAINMLDEMERIFNVLSARLREWYGLHFPELDNIIDSINGYAHIVLGGRREDLTENILEEAGFPDSKTEMIMMVASNSMGGKITDTNLSIVQSIARQVVELHQLRRSMEEHVAVQMDESAPNLAAILGPSVGARMLGRAGSLNRLASLPASTIQVLGAEKALFRSLKTGSQPPKHGLLFQHAMVHAAPRWQRGKIARAIAAKAAIAARVDVYGEGRNDTLLEKLNVRVKEIGEKHEKPVWKEPGPAAMQGRDGRTSKKDRGPSRDRDRSRKTGKTRARSKKRKRVGRR